MTDKTRPAPGRRLTHCRNGHELTPDNLNITRTPTGGERRRCKACEKARSAAWHRAQKGKTMPRSATSSWDAVDLTPAPWHAPDAPVALCAQIDPNAYFADEGAGGRDTREKARDLCAGCPFVNDCLQWALDNHMYYGVWGGTLASERRAMLRGRR